MPEPELPPILDITLWKALVKDGRLAEFRPQDLLKAYDGFCAAGEPSVSKLVLKHVLTELEATIRRAWRTAINEDCLDHGRGLIYLAISEPASARGKALREHFKLTIIRAIKDANRTAQCRPDKVPDYKLPLLQQQAYSDCMLNAIILIDDKLADEPDPRVREACLMRILGYNEAEVSALVGATEKTIRGWLKKNNLHPKSDDNPLR